MPGRSSTFWWVLPGDRRPLIDRPGSHPAEARGVTLGQTPVAMALVRTTERLTLG